MNVKNNVLQSMCPFRRSSYHSIQLMSPDSKQHLTPLSPEYIQKYMNQGQQQNKSIQYHHVEHTIYSGISNTYRPAIFPCSDIL